MRIARPGRREFYLRRRPLPCMQNSRFRLAAVGQREHARRSFPLYSIDDAGRRAICSSERSRAAGSRMRIPTSSTTMWTHLNAVRRGPRRTEERCAMEEDGIRDMRVQRSAASRDHRRGWNSLRKLANPPTSCGSISGLLASDSRARRSPRLQPGGAHWTAGHLRHGTRVERFAGFKSEVLITGFAREEAPSCCRG